MQCRCMYLRVVRGLEVVINTNVSVFTSILKVALRFSKSGQVGAFNGTRCLRLRRLEEWKCNVQILLIEHMLTFKVMTVVNSKAYN